MMPTRQQQLLLMSEKILNDMAILSIEHNSWFVTEAWSWSSIVVTEFAKSNKRIALN